MTRSPKRYAAFDTPPPCGSGQRGERYVRELNRRARLGWKLKAVAGRTTILEKP